VTAGQSALSGANNARGDPTGTRLCARYGVAFYVQAESVPSGWDGRSRFCLESGRWVPRRPSTASCLLVPPAGAGQRRLLMSKASAVLWGLVLRAGQDGDVQVAATTAPPAHRGAPDRRTRVMVSPSRSHAEPIRFRLATTPLAGGAQQRPLRRRSVTAMRRTRPQ
jgi:hypothetical protein